MSTGKRPDPRRRKSRHPHASNFKIANGTKDHGYKAGELFGCYGHRIHAHLPCLLDVTEDKLPCPYCAAGVAVVWRGYVPIWDRDWSLRYALIGEDIFDSVDAIPHRAQVSLSRAKNPISPLIVRQELGLTRELPDREPWSQPVNMLEVCLTLWKLPELVAYFEQHPVAITKPTAKEPKKSDGQPFGPMTRAAAKKYEPPATDEAQEANFDQVVNRLKVNATKLPAGSNGKKPH